MKYKALACCLLLINASCSNLGSTALTPDRLSYNQALVKSDEQQSLLNIVRLRYSDTPYFLSVNNVVSQFNYSNDFGLNIANSAGPPSLLASGNGSFSYSEGPTLTYTPLQGEDYVKRLLLPINLRVIYMILRSGWNPGVVIRMMVQKFGDLDNLALASRAPTCHAPQYSHFKDIGLLFSDWEDKYGLEINNDLIDGEFAIKLTFTRWENIPLKDRTLLAKYNVTKHSNSLWLVTNRSRAKNQIYLQTRTVLGVLNYLSKGTDVPENDLKTKQALTSYTDDGKPFNWHLIVTPNIIRIRSSSSKPENAFVSILYRGSWFYVLNCDFHSKDSLNVLALLMGIYQGEIKSVLPVFTVS